MSSFKTHIEIEVEVEYDYQPFEQQTQTDPEVPADIENICVSFKAKDHEGKDYLFIEDHLDKSALESIKQQCLENEATKYDRSL